MFPSFTIWLLSVTVHKGKQDKCLSLYFIISFQDNKLVSYYPLKVIIFFKCHYEHMDLNIFDEFQTTVIIPMIEIYIVQPLANRNLFK